MSYKIPAKLVNAPFRRSEICEELLRINTDLLCIERKAANGQWRYYMGFDTENITKNDFEVYTSLCGVVLIGRIPFDAIEALLVKY